MATINYFGLTGIKDSVVVALTLTIDQLISSIATDEGLSTEYYDISLLSDPSKSSLTYGDSSTTLTALGFVDGSVVLCTPNQRGSKQERQMQKLDIAKIKKQAGGDTTKTYYRAANVLDTTLLPTLYSGNDVVDNANTGGLVAGRPWTV